MEEHKNGMAELMQAEGIILTINADADGLKSWNKAHSRHVQKGPDVLSISAPDCNLKFKTTFMPGSEVGRLHCIIAGELATIEGMDFRPDDWATLSDKLTTRNTARIEGNPATEKHKMDIQPFIEAMSQWEKASSAFQEEFKKSNDPLVVIRFLKEDPFALRSIWVEREVEQWLHGGRYDLLDLVFSRQKGHSKDEHGEQLKDFLLVIEVDKITSKGFTKEQAFEKLTAFMGRHRSINAVRKAYYRCKKQMYQKFFFETPDSYICEVRNTKVSFLDKNGEEHSFFATWTYTLPK